MNVIIDRFEGNYAVVELNSKTTANMPKILLPLNAKEGDVIKIIIDTQKTQQLKKDIQNLRHDVWDD